MKNLLKFSLIVVLITFFYQDIIAQTKLSVQGVIRQSDGNAVEDGEYAITFKLYDTLTNGNLLWTETQSNLNVISGIYSTILGEVTPLNLPFDQFYFLSLTIDGEELLPRAPLTSSPYANALIGFDNAFPSSGNVGIGTLNPVYKLDVEGSAAVQELEVEGKANIQDTLFANGIQYTGYLTSPSENGILRMEGLRVDIDNPNGGDCAIQFSNGPDGGNFEVRVDGNKNGALWNYEPNDIIFGTNNTERMRLKGNGRLGVDIPDPSHILHVNGVARSTQSTWATSSDGRVKKNVKELKNVALANIMKLRPVHYQWTSEYKNENDGLKENNTGFISQDIEQVFPEMVTQVTETFGDKTIVDFRVLNLSDLPVYLVKAMQEQQNQIEKLIVLNSELKSALKRQEKEVNDKLSMLESKINELIKEQSLTRL